jgi:hypothetical protein
MRNEDPIYAKTPENPPQCHVPLKVVTNEKRGGSGSWQVFEGGTGP